MAHLNQYETETFKAFVERGKRDGSFVEAAMGLSRFHMAALFTMGYVTQISVGRYALTLAGERLADEMFREVKPLTPKEQYKAAYRNARMQRNNNYHNFTDRFDARYHEKSQFVEVESRFYKAAKEALVQDGLSFEGWITSNGRITVGALKNRKNGNPYYIPQWLKDAMKG